MRTISPATIKRNNWRGKIGARAAQVARRVVNGTLGTAEAAPRKIRPRIIYEPQKPGARLIWVWRGLLS